MNAQHTPPPWTHEGQGGITGIENDPANGCVGKVDVACVYLRTVPGRTESNASAPEMLKALQGVRMMAVCGQLDQFVGEPWLNAVFAVTAKAEGGGVPAGKLWAIHIPGPNDDHAAPSESMAKAMVAKHNAAMREYVSKNKLDWGPEMITAKVVEWPWTAEEHAVEVAEFDYAAWGFGNGGVSE